MLNKGMKGASQSEIKRVENKLNELRAALTHFRQAKSFSQESLAEKTDISTSTIQYIEQGRRAPSLVMLIRLCLALNLEITIKPKKD